MKSSYSAGATNAIMIVNIALAVIIALAVSFLFRANVQEKLSTNAKTSTNTLEVTAEPAATIAPSQNEIDMLKANLERETSRLEQLRQQEILVEKYRRLAQPTFEYP